MNKINWLASFLMFLVTTNLQAAVDRMSCMSNYNTICQKILKLNAKMDHKEALKLSNIFFKVSRKYKLSSDLLVSIAFQESRFRKDIIRKVTGLIYKENTSEFEEIRVGSDFCMMQIHFSNIKKMKLNTVKLLKEEQYCIETGAKILSLYKKQYSVKDAKWWTYYNAKTKLKREIYFKHVSRHLVKIKKKAALNTRKVASKRIKHH